MVAPHARPVPNVVVSVPYPPRGTAHTHMLSSYPLTASPPRPFPSPHSPCTRPVPGIKSFPSQRQIASARAPLAVTAHPVPVVSVPRTSEQTLPKMRLPNSESSLFVFFFFSQEHAERRRLGRSSQVKNVDGAVRAIMQSNDAAETTSMRRSVSSQRLFPNVCSMQVVCALLRSSSFFI
jgi:hypothetical protein